MAHGKWNIILQGWHSFMCENKGTKVSFSCSLAEVSKKWEGKMTTEQRKRRVGKSEFGWSTSPRDRFISERKSERGGARRETRARPPSSQDAAASAMSTGVSYAMVWLFYCSWLADERPFSQPLTSKLIIDKQRGQPSTKEVLFVHTSWQPRKVMTIKHFAQAVHNGIRN